MFELYFIPHFKYYSDFTLNILFYIDITFYFEYFIISGYDIPLNLSQIH